MSGVSLENARDAQARDHWNKSIVAQFIGKVPNLSYIQRMGKAGSVARFSILANEADEVIFANIQDESCSIKGSLSIDKGKRVIHEGEVMDKANETISDSDFEANLEKSNGRPKLPLVGSVRP
ncbi:hypothetical protein PTKIN_Ptkin01aG0297900 [Pterospermum kingtungense]